MARRFGMQHAQRAEAAAYLAGRSETYACIAALDVIEHLPKERAAPLLAAARQALRPGGVFIMHAPCAGGPFGARYRYEDMTHTIAFTARSVRQALAAAGFGEAQVRPARPVVTGLRALVRAGLWRGIEAGLIAMHLIETGSARDLVVTQNLIAVAWRPR